MVGDAIQDIELVVGQHHAVVSGLGRASQRGFHLRKILRHLQILQQVHPAKFGFGGLGGQNGHEDVAGKRRGRPADMLSDRHASKPHEKEQRQQRLRPLFHLCRQLACGRSSQPSSIKDSVRRHDRPTTLAELKSRLQWRVAECDRRGLAVDVNQEPFRRGRRVGACDCLFPDGFPRVAGRRAPPAGAFTTEAIAGTSPDNEPRRSFDMRQQRLFDHLDEEERKVVEAVAPELRCQ